MAREYLIALPVELTAEQQVKVVRGFGRELSERYRFALDVAIHAPRDFHGSDPRNFHAHLLATTREVSREGLGRKTTLEIPEARRRELGLDPSIKELLFVRQRWAEVANEALASAHLDARIDHRTLEAQGISREPKLWIPRVAYEVERRGFSSPVADRMREEHRHRLEAHQAAVLESRAAGPKPMSLQDVQRQSVENWLRLRREAQHPEATRSDSREHTEDCDRGRAGPDRDGDLGL